MIIRILYISFRKNMMKALKKNQIVIFAIALMLITAGYLNYSMKTEETAQTTEVIQESAGIGDAQLVSSATPVNEVQKNVLENNMVSNSVNTTNTIIDAEDDETIQSSANVNNTKESTNKNTNQYFTESRLERENMYSEMLASYQSVLSNVNISAEEKSAAQKEISNINSQKNAIMIAENLIKNKGFSNVVIFVNNESVSVIVEKTKLEESEIAQIQSIVQRELNSNLENIHISNK